MKITNPPSWQEIEAQILILLDTGMWPDPIPDWVNEVKKRFHCHEISGVVIQQGLWEIVRQLKDELKMERGE